MKTIQLVLNNNYIDSIIGELEKMKTNKNKIIKIASDDKSIALVMSHEDSDIYKK